MGSSEWNSLLARQILDETKTTIMEDALLIKLDRALRPLGVPKYPIDLPLVASVLGIDPDVKTVEMTQAGRLVSIDGKWHIEVNATHPHVRQQFSIAHEIGHKVLLHSKSSIPKERLPHNRDLEKDEEERICDLFATLLLGLRHGNIVQILEERGFSLATVDFITKEFDVSFEAAARAISRYAETPGAFLYCLHGPQQDTDLFYVQRYYAAQKFPFALSTRLILPPFNCLHRAWLGHGTAKTAERWQFQGHPVHSCILEAKRMPIYSSDTKEAGLVVAVIVQ